MRDETLNATVRCHSQTPHAGHHAQTSQRDHQPMRVAGGKLAFIRFEPIGKAKIQSAKNFFSPSANGTPLPRAFRQKTDVQRERDARVSRKGRLPALNSHGAIVRHSRGKNSGGPIRVLRFRPSFSPFAHGCLAIAAHLT